MEPIIYDKKTKNETLEFTIKNIDVSFANAIRRTIISGIETIGIISAPHNENNVNISLNTSRINNEIISHRLSLIPIHELTKDNYHKYIIEIDEDNKTDDLYYITTQHFKILDTTENKYLNSSSVEKIFPPWYAPNGKKYFIDLIPLRPKMGNIDGEKLKLNASLSIVSASRDSSFNVANDCYFTNTLDPIEIKNQEKIQKEKEKEKEKDKEKNKENLKNWEFLTKNRYFLPNSFDFKIKTCSKFTNEDLFRLSCKKIISDLSKIKEIELNIKMANSTIENCYNIELEGINYTIGNIINYVLLNKVGDIITVSSFKLTHPHNSFGTLQIGFKINVGNDIITQHIRKSCDISITIFEKIEKLI
uniref:DNA-directed RNA polymerase RpoA/D/Rpb3-type domain-containing protein n=1 Tax=viral metagenome TaxID=1070528 RepID=A0A6C0H5W3_9ZZZZ